MQKEQELKDSQIRKHYKEGDHVKVLSGQHEGATGLIVKVDDSSNTVVLFSDTTQQEVSPDLY
jgi:transcription elongation factor SPT5